MSKVLTLARSHFAEVIASARDAIVSTDREQRVVLFNGAAERMFGRAASEVIGQSVEQVIAEGLRLGTNPVTGGGDSGVEVPLTGPLTAGRQAHRPCVLTGLRGDGSRFPIEAAISQSEAASHPVLTAIVRDITDSVQALDRGRRCEEELADLFTNSPIGLMCVAPDGRVERVNRAQLCLLGRPMDEVLGRSVGELLIDGESVAGLLRRLARGETVHDLHVRTATAAGLKHVLVDANGVWVDGALVRSRWFSRDITSRIKLEAEILAIAEQERRRIGQDLHDDVCQQLVAIEFMVEALAARWHAKADDSADQAHAISFHLRVAINRSRELARGLDPSLPDQPEGLMAAMQELAERTTRIYRRECTFDCPQPAPSPDHATTIHLFRIAQEAVGNAIKHGQARHITIRLAGNGPDLVLSVSDDGNGATPDPASRRGMGLRVMQYRARAIGGTLVIQRIPNRGTSVICTVKVADGGPPPPQ